MLQCEVLSSASKTNFPCRGYRTYTKGIGFFSNFYSTSEACRLRPSSNATTRFGAPSGVPFGFCAKSFLHHLVVHIKNKSVKDQTVDLPFDFALRSSRTLGGSFCFPTYEKRSGIYPEFFLKNRKGNRGNLICWNFIQMSSAQIHR